MQAMMILTGYLGHDIELRHTRTGVPTVSFRMGTTPRIKTQDGWTDGTTTWTSVMCYRNLADHVARSLNKGDPVIVYGRVRTQTWEDQGKTHEKTFVEARFIGHDLNRGICTFEKATRHGDPVDTPPEPSDGAEPVMEPSLDDEFEDDATE